LFLIVAVLLMTSAALAGDVSGLYLEARTCQVYTGPCFANGEVGLTGNDAIMAWSIDKGEQDGVDLAGLNVIVVLRADDTLAFGGIEEAEGLKSVILVDNKAKGKQRDALIAFAKQHSGKAGQAVVRVDAVPIEMSLDVAKLDGKLQAGKEVKLLTRKARPEDCICSNESAYYPPLAKLENFAPGVTIDGGFNGRGLGSRWSIPDSRSAYMATFAY
jgi:hypothetical protein